jgi:hypothetical protein
VADRLVMNHPIRWSAFDFSPHGNLLCVCALEFPMFVCFCCFYVLENIGLSKHMVSMHILASSLSFK